MERPGGWRVHRRIICTITAAGCAGTCAFMAFLSWIAFQADWSLSEAYAMAFRTGSLAVACASAFVLCFMRLGSKADAWLRSLVCVLCLGSIMFALTPWQNFGHQDWWLLIVPLIASGVIWLTPGPIPSHLCTSCGYDTRNLPTSTCPECGTPFDNTSKSPAR